MSVLSLVEDYRKVRQRSTEICARLRAEDYVVQPVLDVSPPKWHLGHTTWFFETFILRQSVEGYKEFNPHYNFLFNSYYEAEGARVIRTDRGNLSRPSVEDIFEYRAYVDRCMIEFLISNRLHTRSLTDLVILGLNHEQQHQELLITDIKYILGHNPLFPAYDADDYVERSEPGQGEPLAINEGVYKIGFRGEGFCFDNELGAHKVYLYDFVISKALVTNAEYLDFINDGGYQSFRHWHAEGWDWVKQSQAKAPLYWHFIDDKWMNYTLSGLKQVAPSASLSHINFYEASAFASWKGMRLPTEAEWEVASKEFNWGSRWEWTGSAYLPYPGYQKATGAIGEYNGKFMVNQMVLRGASVATPTGHSRSTYRNFFHPEHRWQFTGIRLAK